MQCSNFFLRSASLPLCWSDFDLLWLRLSFDAGQRHGADTNVLVISQYDDELGTVRDELGSLTRLGSKKSVDVARCDKAMIDDLGIDVKSKRFKTPAVTSDGAPAALKEHTCIMTLLGLAVIMRFICDCHSLSLGSCKSSEKAFGDRGDMETCHVEQLQFKISYLFDTRPAKYESIWRSKFGSWIGKIQMLISTRWLYATRNAKKIIANNPCWCSLRSACTRR